MFSDPDWSWLCIGPNLFWVAKVVHIKLATFWAMLPESKNGLGFTLQELKLVYSITPIAVTLCMLILHILSRDTSKENSAARQRRNWKTILCTSVINFGSSLIYIVVICLPSRAFTIGFLVFKETLMLTSVSMNFLVANEEASETVPKAIYSCFLSAGNIVYSFGAGFGVLLVQTGFSYLLNSKVIADLFGSLQPLVAFSPLVALFAYAMVCEFKHYYRNVKQHLNNA